MTMTWSTLTRHTLVASLLAVLPWTTAGCIEDSDCGICDPNNLILESISGVNYASNKIHLLSPECNGPECPADLSTGTYFIEEVIPCQDTEKAKASPRGPEEFCKISPLVSAFGIEFVFNNLLEPTSIELVRKRPDNPQLFEVYDWKHQVLEIQGPITRYNGDFVKGGNERPDQVTRLVNLSCIDNLAAQGIPYSHEDYADPMTDPCNKIDGSGVPAKMDMNGVMKSYGGLRTAFANSCDTPEDGADTCCSECDFLLATQVAKYGLSAPLGAEASRDEAAPLMLSPNPVLADLGAEPIDYETYGGVPGGAITCNPDPMTGGDKYLECESFIPWVSRALEERTYRYGFCDPTDSSCEPQEYRLPYYDKLRETHPDARPANLERKNAHCTTSPECTSVENGHGLPGTECVGHLESNPSQACTPGVTEGCIEGRCVAEWFVTCRQQPDTTGETGFCFDKRFSERGVGACFIAEADFDVLCDENGEGCQTARPGRGPFPIVHCDHNEDGALSALECCQSTLDASGQDGRDGQFCDPAVQTALRPVDIYKRNQTLPEVTRDCRCPTGGSESDVDPSDPCARSIISGCFDREGRLKPDRANQYAVKFIERAGGVIYDPAIKGFEFRPADVGNVRRAEVERCAEDRGNIALRNREDGWRANDVFITENFEDFDRALCSGQEYTVVFNGPEDGKQFIVDKSGNANTLEGKSRYRFETPQFHVVPGSGFPTDNLRIGACDDFALRFSNKYDLSPSNVQKIQIWRIAEKDVTTPENLLSPTTDGSCPVGPVAGGPGCAPTADLLEDDPCRPPCLSVDIANVGIGELAVQIDPAEFGAVLDTKELYRMTVAGLSSLDEASDPEAYQRAFWDACGMPLILGETDEVDYLYDFKIDQPKCKEDQDRDGVQLSCDNAPDFFNPNQADTDGDNVGDVVDLCPTVPGAVNNSADSDKDGVGNECDNCRQTVKQYNRAEANPPTIMMVRNIPFQTDTDRDGIGDVCDNCIHVANCQDYGSSNPYSVGDPIAYDDETACNQDLNNNMVGDACEGAFDESIAAGPIGLGPTDDFDQDGIGNLVDACPRQPLPEQIACESSDDCPENSKCETDYGVCDHLDSDSDGVGDICDTCVFDPNPLQVMDGQMQEDDEDGDFVGRTCETNNACENRADPRPFAFYEIAANGNCCTVALKEATAQDVAELLAEEGLVVAVGDLINATTELPLIDPDGLPIRLDCSDEQETAAVCRRLPMDVARTHGIINVPAGCEEALDGRDPSENQQYTANHPEINGDLDLLWDKLCFQPQFDQDYDGFGDICDLCPFDFDPDNKPFINAEGKVWPKSGKYCNGEYSIETKCSDEDEDATATGTGGGSGSGGSDGGSDGGSTGG